MRWDSEIKDIVQVVDKRAGWRHHNVFRLCPWLIHDDLMEAADHEVHDAALVDFDFRRQNVVIGRAR